MAEAPAEPAKPEITIEGFNADPEKRFTGKVMMYYKFNGYGWLSMDEEGVVPNDKVFVFWKSLKSADRYPALAKDMEVQFSVIKEEKQGTTSLCASNVTNADGSEVSIQGELDAKKEFVGGADARYKGTLKWYAPKRGFGYITIAEGITFDEEVPNEIRVETAEINAGGKNPQHAKDLEVQFGIWKTRKGRYKAFNMTLVDGALFPGDDC